MTQFAKIRLPFVARFFRDEHGSIPIEAVIFFPLYMFLMVGTLTFWDAFKAQSHNAKLAYTISDIMSRHKVVTDTDMTYLTGLQQKMLPGSLDRRTIRISSICFANGSHKVLWSYTANSPDTSQVPALQTPQIPTSILPFMADQESVILTEVGGRWQPLITLAGVTEKSWNTELVIRPRFQNFIPHQTLNAANTCPV